MSSMTRTVYTYSTNNRKGKTHKRIDLKHRKMRYIAANRSILTAIDQNATFPDNNGSYSSGMTNDIDSTDNIQLADGWYSYPDLNTFDSDILLNILTIRINIKPTKIISLWNIKAENPTILPLTEIGRLLINYSFFFF